MAFGHTGKWRWCPIGYIALLATILPFVENWNLTVQTLKGLIPGLVTYQPQFAVQSGGIYKLVAEPEKESFDYYFNHINNKYDFDQMSDELSLVHTGPTVGMWFSKFTVLAETIISISLAIGMSVETTGISFLVAVVFCIVDIVFEIGLLLFGGYLFATGSFLQSNGELRDMCKYSMFTGILDKNFDWPMSFLITSLTLIPRLLIKSWFIELYATMFNIASVKGSPFNGMDPCDYGNWHDVDEKRRENGVLNTGYGKDLWLHKETRKVAQKMRDLKTQQDEAKARDREQRKLQLEELQYAERKRKAQEEMKFQSAMNNYGTIDTPNTLMPIRE